MSARLYPFGRPVDTENASSYRHVCFVKRVGLRWQVWHEYEDGHAEPNGAKEWRSVYAVSFWRRINALRVAADMTRMHLEGGHLEFLRTGDQHYRTDRLRDALSECVDTLALCRDSSEPNPVVAGAVNALCVSFGYGEVMHAASHMWGEMLARSGASTNGAFAVGPCRGSVEKVLQVARDALALDQSR